MPRKSIYNSKRFMEYSFCNKCGIQFNYLRMYHGGRIRTICNNCKKINKIEQNIKRLEKYYSNQVKQKMNDEFIMKYFVIKMNQPLNLDRLNCEISRLKEESHQKIILGRDLAKIILKTME